MPPIVGGIHPGIRDGYDWRLAWRGSSLLATAVALLQALNELPGAAPATGGESR
jgi:hypothetical protein